MLYTIVQTLKAVVVVGDPGVARAQLNVARVQAVEATLVAVCVVRQRGTRHVLTQSHALSNHQRLDNHLLRARAFSTALGKPFTVHVLRFGCNKYIVVTRLVYEYILVSTQQHPLR